MSKTFGSRVREFALTVDDIDDDVFDGLWQLVTLYLEQEFNFCYCALLFHNEVNRNDGLLTWQSSDGRKPAFSLRNADNRFNGLAAFSFSQGKPLWITTPEREPLDGNTFLRDLWFGMKELPIHVSADQPAKTAVFVPLFWQGKTIGVLDIQLPDYNEPTTIVKEELQQIGDTFAEIYVLYQNNATQKNNTKEAINRLKKSFKEETWPPLTKPKVFIASSGRADDLVMGIIKGTLDEFHDQLRYHYWKQSSKSGNINWDILQQIKASRFGICYFSEPIENPCKGEPSYIDNPNVIFEAGMFQALTNPSPTEHPTGWIPIREAHPTLTSPPPFDFAQQRMIIIERDNDNRPNTDKLKADLKGHIENLLNRSTY
jgi:hypothetical protein